MERKTPEEKQGTHRARPEVERLESRTLLSAYSLLQTLAVFTYTDGANPVGRVTLDSNGDLFGTTTGLPASMVFEIAQGATSITSLAAFSPGSLNGALALDSSGNLFGTTGGPIASEGTVFEIAHGTASSSSLSLSYAGGLVVDSIGNLFGTAVGSYTTSSSGASEAAGGMVFEIPQGTTSIITLATFSGASSPQAGLALDSSGDLFGTTAGGGVGGYGTVFEIPQGTTSVATLATFNDSNGTYPNPALTLDSSGDLFGTTPEGNAVFEGEAPPGPTVFEIAHGATSITTLVSFSSNSGPNDGLALDSSGDLFGTTEDGGASGDGTVFELPEGATSVTTLVNFNGTNGATPEAGPTLDSSGNLFGTTEEGGDLALGNGNGDGTVFELKTFSVLSAPNVTAAGGAGEKVTVVYNDSVAVSAASITTGNISVTGPGGALSVTGVSLSPSSDAATITATYTVAAPAGSWSVADDGTYTVNLLAGQVNDTADYANSAADTTFTVAIIDPATSTVSVSPTFIGGNGTVTLQAKDSKGNDLTIGGLTNVMFTLSGALTQTLTAMDNGNGTYSATFAANSPGAFTVAASAYGVPISSTASTTVNSFVVNLRPPVGFTYKPGHLFTLQLDDTSSTAGLLASRASPIRIQLGLSSNSDGANAMPLGSAFSDPMSIKPENTRNFAIKLAALPNLDLSQTYYLTATASTAAGLDGFGVSPAILSPASVSARVPPAVVKLKISQLTRGKAVTFQLLNTGTIAVNPGSIELLGLSLSPSGARPVASIATPTVGFSISAAAVGKAARTTVRVLVKAASGVTLQPGTWYLVANVTAAANPLVLAALDLS